MITLELAKTKLNELNVLIRYLPFLQNNGFSDLGKGKILGQVQLLKELINEQGEHLEYNEEIPQETRFGLHTKKRGQIRTAIIQLLLLLSETKWKNT